jgi:hypothetical protein
MEIINNGLEDIKSAVVVVNPGTREEGTYLIKEVITSKSGAWFYHHVNLSRGTPTQVTFNLKYVPGHRINRVKLFGNVVRSEPGRFEIAF